MQTIHWFPGHMAAAMRKIGATLRLVDAVVEVLDARLPAATANPELRTLVETRPVLSVLSRIDLADPEATARWLAHLAAEGRTALAIDARRHADANRVLDALRALGSRGGPLRAIVVGIPNSGKSTLINALLRRKSAPAQDRAGVTRALQWFRLDPLVELMDSPGILVPKIETPEAQWKLALTGALPRERYDPEDVVARFAAWDAARPGGPRFPELEAFAAARGFLRRGGEVDWHNAAGAYLAALNAGTFGPLTLEEPA